MELLKLLSPSSPTLERGFGAPETTWEDVAAAMAKISPLASLYARVIYLRDHAREDELAQAILLVAVEAGWPEKNGDIWRKDRLYQLIYLALEEERDDRSRCGQCLGVGRIGTFQCEKCGGAGLRKPTLASRARALNISPKAFKKSWSRRYDDIILPIVSYLAMEVFLIKSKIGK